MPNGTPPFRADHVGSLLRPPALRDARAARAEGRLDRNGSGANTSARTEPTTSGPKTRTPASSSATSPNRATQRPPERSRASSSATPAPAASASATSRGCRTPPSAQIARPRSAAASAQSSTAENWGRPTAVCMRVVHMAPGPTPTLTTSAPASSRSTVPSAVTTLPPTIGTRTPVRCAWSSRTRRTTPRDSSMRSW